jgi:hypothetical protein
MSMYKISTVLRADPTDVRVPMFLVKGLEMTEKNKVSDVRSKDHFRPSRHCSSPSSSTKDLLFGINI